MTFLILILYIISLAEIYGNLTSNSFCGSHLLPKTDQKRLIEDSIKKINENESRNDSKRKLSEEFSPINIIIDNSIIRYQQEFDELVSYTKYTLVMNSLTKAAQMLSELISVKHNNAQIELNKAETINKCRLEKYSESYLSPNTLPSSSVVIYPRFHNFNQNGQNNILTSGTFCALDTAGYGRPTAGFIYIEKNITELELKKINIDKYYTMMFLHELTHILVFDRLILEEYIPYIFRNITILNQDRKTINSTTVVEKARKHFGCPTIKGIELENQEYIWKNKYEETTDGYLDKYQNHWDARIMLTDYMTSVNYDESVISEITLALFEDSGWYKANYFTGGLFRYGKNQGCSFINSYCVYGGISFFKNEYCITEKITMCTPGRTHRAMCGLMSYPTELETYYRYFTDSRKGGHLAQADYCPVAKTNSSISKTYYYQGHCNYGEAEIYPESLGYKMGSTSICLLSSLTPKNDDETLKEYPSSFRALCYKVKCFINDGEKGIIIYIGNNAVICPASGGTQTIDGYYGYILCPDYNLICTGKIWCLDPITCVEQHSEVDEESFIYNYQPATSQDYQDLLNYKIPTEDNIPLYAYYINRINYFTYFLFFSFIILSL